jgi:hypothetical protein
MRTNATTVRSQEINMVPTILSVLSSGRSGVLDGTYPGHSRRHPVEVNSMSARA